MFTGLDRAELLPLVKEGAFLVQFDRAHAMATLAELLATRQDRERALRIAREVITWRPDLMPELEAELERLAEALALKEGPAAGTAQLVG